MISESEKIRIENLSKKLRRDVVEMIGIGMAGHIGGSCSSADLITKYARAYVLPASM